MFVQDEEVAELFVALAQCNAGMYSLTNINQVAGQKDGKTPPDSNIIFFT